MDIRVGIFSEGLELTPVGIMSIILSLWKQPVNTEVGSPCFQPCKPFDFIVINKWSMDEPLTISSYWSKCSN